MEGFLVIIFLTIGLNLFLMIGKALFSAGADVLAPNTSLSHKFNLNIVKGTGDFNHEEMEVFKIRIKGKVRNNRSNYNARYILRLYDVTDDIRNPIMGTIEEFQEKNSTAFRFITKPIIIPYEEAIYENWVDILHIPTIFLEFPKKGTRKVEATIQVIDDNLQILESSISTIFYNSTTGYLERIENIKKFEEKAIKVALLLSSSDGNIDLLEKNIIEEWIKRRTRVSNFNCNIEERNRLFKYLEEGEREIRRGFRVSDYLSDIGDYATEGKKYEIYELCLKVASIDNVAKKEELEMLNEIAKLMNLDKSKYKAMTEKELPITMYEASSISHENMIGITKHMNKPEIKKHLMTEYRKWNARVSNSNPEIREQAEEMITIIAELRKKYK